MSGTTRRPTQFHVSEDVNHQGHYTSRVGCVAYVLLLPAAMLVEKWQKEKANFMSP
jgi:hypothetical protein